MLKDVVVYGNSVLSKMLFYEADSSESFKIACFTVDKEYLNGTEFLGLPLIDFEYITDLYPPDQYDMMAVMMGYTNMRFKEDFYLRGKGKGYNFRNFTSPKADFYPDITMGENNIIFAQSHIGLGGRMGNNNIIRQNVYLGHDFIMGNNNVIASGCIIGGKCIIKNTCYIGLGAIVLDNITIEEETLVGAGSLLIRNTEPYSKNVGNPSRVLGYHREEGIKIGNRHG